MFTGDGRQITADKFWFREIIDLVDEEFAESLRLGQQDPLQVSGNIVTDQAIVGHFLLPLSHLGERRFNKD